MLFLPEQASTFAPRVDRLHYFVFIVTMAVVGGRRPGGGLLLLPLPGADEERLDPGGGAQRALRERGHRHPAVLFLVWVFVGFKDYIWYTNPPKASMDVYVTGKKWMWHFALPTAPTPTPP